jgi:GxxExxY protein
MRLSGRRWKSTTNSEPVFLNTYTTRHLQIEFGLRNVPFRSQERFVIDYKGHILDREYVADFFCFEGIIVEIKAVGALSPVDYAQVINYLKVSGCRVGLLFNFGSHGKLEWRKLVI